MKNKISILFILSLTIFILSIFFLSLSKEKIYNTENLINDKIENFQIKDLITDKIIDKNEIKLNNFILINFWASWCAPCRAEHKYLMSLEKEEEIKIVGINFKDKKKQALFFLEDLGNPYYLLGEDRSGKVSVQFGVYGIPESILLDKEMKIIKKFIGPIDDEDYKIILKMIKKK
mgnify:FL=1